MTTFSRASSCRKRLTRPLLREEAPHEQAYNCLRIKKNLLLGLRCCFTPRHSITLILSRKHFNMKLCIYLNRDEKVAPHPGCFVPRERAPDSHTMRGFVDSKPVWRLWQREKSLPATGKWTQLIQFVTWSLYGLRYLDSCTGAGAGKMWWKCFYLIQISLITYIFSLVKEYVRHEREPAWIETLSEYSHNVCYGSWQEGIEKLRKLKFNAQRCGILKWRKCFELRDFFFPAALSL
jgi:hypothetical protein